MSSKRGQKEKPRRAINTGNKNKGGLGAKTCSSKGPVEKGVGQCLTGTIGLRKVNGNEISMSVMSSRLFIFCLVLNVLDGLSLFA